MNISDFFKVGKYIRWGVILSKIINIYQKNNNQWKLILDRDINFNFGITFYENAKKENRVKDSLFDCIEINDYVNGYKVKDIKIGKNGNRYVKLDSLEKDIIYECEIENVMPKECISIYGYDIKGDDKE